MLERLGRSKTNVPETPRPAETPVRRPVNPELTNIPEPPVRRAVNATVAESSDPAPAITYISAGMTVVGKIAGEGIVKVFGRIEGELRASNVTIAEGAQVEGEVFADDLTVGGRVKGNVHANRVRLDSTSIVEGDIFHRSLAIEENARFEGASRREANGVDLSARGSSQAAAGDRRGNGGANDGDSYVAQRMGSISSMGGSANDVISH